MSSQHAKLIARAGAPEWCGSRPEKERRSGDPLPVGDIAPFDNTLIAGNRCRSTIGRCGPGAASIGFERHAAARPHSIVFNALSIMAARSEIRGHIAEGLFAEEQNECTPPPILVSVKARGLTDYKLNSPPASHSALS